MKWIESRTTFRKPAAVRPPWYQITVRRMMVLVALTVPMLLFVRAARDARENACRAQCRGNLCQIALAFHNYHEAYGRWPPAYVADASGNPMHSWRVLILPFIEQSGLYNSYNFSQPWNSQSNRRLIGMMPDPYACPSHGASSSGLTDYVVIVGPATAFPGARSTTLDEIKDDRHDTILEAIRKEMADF